MNKDIKEINRHISDALEQWSDIMLRADADGWSYHLDYSDADLLNAMEMFFHVASNKAIKAGQYKEPADAQEAMAGLKKAIKACFGFDTVELTNKVLGIDKNG